MVLELLKNCLWHLECVQGLAVITLTVTSRSIDFCAWKMNYHTEKAQMCILALNTVPLTPESFENDSSYWQKDTVVIWCQNNAWGLLFFFVFFSRLLFFFSSVKKRQVWFCENASKEQEWTKFSICTMKGWHTGLLHVTSNNFSNFSFWFQFWSFGHCFY